MMALFHFGKKKEEKKASSCCGENTAVRAEESASCCCGCAPEAEGSTSCCGKSVEGICCVKVLGSGCKNCRAVLEAAKEAVQNIGLNLEVEYVTDMEKIMAYGVMSMPALVVNERVVSMGKVLKTAEAEKLLRSYEG